MKKLLILIFFISIATNAQKNVNNYKYIIVPKQFSFLNEVDKYQTSSLTKFLFKKNGFNVFLDDEQFPEDLANNRCNALVASVNNGSGMFVTKIVIELRDCNNVVVFKTSEGRSKIKEYKKAYHEAIRGAFKTIESLRYAYKTPENQVEVVNPVPKVLPNTPSAPSFTKTTEVKANVVKENNNLITSLIAKPIKNGFDMYNAQQELVFTALKTNLKDVYVLKQQQGILYKENNNWIADYYDTNGNKVGKQYIINMSF